jgi:hypothetical protein
MFGYINIAHYTGEFKRGWATRWRSAKQTADKKHQRWGKQSIVNDAETNMQTSELKDFCSRSHAPGMRCAPLRRRVCYDTEGIERL